jgi:lipopolysaccharide transport system ATP-binding protein
VGKNGAGKSTLLKILSRVTSPTTGDIKIKGRIASLLEVGTGFHPEMTGRENIFMNGSIMGMTKAEIKSKFDEIVDFAGVAKYVDTPVKRYSSGMMVRLGFAIAAHLEPEILVVDEVLAVGDAEFQKKAIGKMQDVSKGEGRTVLFVSHNMAAVKSLCQKGVVLENGQLAFQGNIDDSLRYYLHSGTQNEGKRIIDSIKHHKQTLHFDKIMINGTEMNESIISSDQHTLSLSIEGYADEELKTDVMLILKSKSETPLASLAEGYYRGKLDTIPKGHFCINKTIQLPKYLSVGRLYCDLMMHLPRVEWHLQAPNCCCLDCEGYQEEFGFIIDQGTYGLMGMELI